MSGNRRVYSMVLTVVVGVLALWMTGCGDSEVESGDPWETCESECSAGSAQCADDGVMTCVEVNGCQVWSEPAACGEEQDCIDGLCRRECDDRCEVGQSQCGDDGVEYCVNIDGCADWSEPVACGDDEVCSDGRCDGVCDGTCEIGDRECAGVGVRVCEYNAEGCPQWSEPSACGVDEACSGGQCVSDCSDQCQEEARQCSSLGDYQICQEQASGCLDWSVPIGCPAEMNCSDGDCVDACTDDCTEGVSQCTGDGFQLCVEQANGCTRWTPSIDCPAQMNCQGGSCVSESCSDQCSDEGTTQCAGSEGFNICQEQANGCLGWSTAVGCPDGTVCSGDECTTTCSDQCTDGATQCSGVGAVQTCEEQASGCLGWSTAVDCGGGEVCDDGQCVDDDSGCSDVCTEGERSCDGSEDFQICMEQSNGCTDWSSAIECPSGLSCDDGQCVDEGCSDQCSQGAIECWGDDFQVCQEQSNGCTDWSAAVSCPAAMVCEDGGCVSDCSDACTEGAMQCAGDEAVEVCQEQSNGCTDWSASISCPVDFGCADESCVSDCSDACSAGDSQCSGDEIQVCQEQSNGCMDWTAPIACGGGTQCNGGACTTSCSDGCSTEGAVQCADGSSIEACQEQVTGCLDWSAPIDCPAGTSCEAGQCLSAGSCAPNTYQCNGDDVEVCNAEGTAYLFVKSCVADCDGGVCVGDCEPGTRQCNGDTVEECNDGGTEFEAVETCDTSCSDITDDCAEDDWLVTSDTSRDGTVVVDGEVIVFSGAELYSPSGTLEIYADSITVQSGGSIVMAATGEDPEGQGVAGTQCSCGQFCTRFVGGTGGSYGEQGGSTGCWQSPDASGRGNTIYVRQGSRGGESRNNDSPGGLGGGVLRLMADEIDMRGSVSADGANATTYIDHLGCTDARRDGGGSGGGIVMEADELDVSGTVSVQGGLASTRDDCNDGDGDGGAGVAKLLHGSVFNDTGTVDGVRYSGLSSPRKIGSSTHPDESRYYNDDFESAELSWQRPFPAVNGYYFTWNQEPHDAPDSGSGDWLSDESVTLERDDLWAGTNYIHFTSVDAQSNTSSMGGRFTVYVNEETPTVSSSSHPDELQWYDSQTVNLSWSDSASEEHFTGYYYAVDHYGDTVPTKDDQYVPIEQKSAVLSNVEEGIWAFHLVSEDTQGYLTRASETFVIRVGDDPGSGNILGNINDEAGSPIEGAEVTINRGLLPEIDDQVTDSDGFFNFGGSVPAGDWEVEIEAQGYETTVVSVSLDDGGNALLNEELSSP